MRLFDPNNQPFPMPSPPTQPTPTPINIQDIIQIRLALDQIRDPSQPMKESMNRLDKIIHSFITSINYNPGPTT